MNQHVDFNLALPAIATELNILSKIYACPASATEAGGLEEEGPIAPDALPPWRRAQATSKRGGGNTEYGFELVSALLHWPPPVWPVAQVQGCG